MSHVMRWKIVDEVGSRVDEKGEKRWKKCSRLFELWSWCVVTLQNYINYNDKLNELYKLCIISSCACLTIKTSPRLITSIKQEKETKVETNCFYSAFFKDMILQKNSLEFILDWMSWFFKHIIKFHGNITRLFFI